MKTSENKLSLKTVFNTVDLVSQLFGAMFWGCIVTAAVTFALFGGLTFLFVYEVSGRFCDSW